MNLEQRPIATTRQQAALLRSAKLGQTQHPRAAREVTADQVRAAGGIVHGDGNVFFTSLAQLSAFVRSAGGAP